MSTAILYITNNGLTLAKRLKGLYPDAKILKFKSEAVSEFWNEYRNLIFIMASGIVVRTIAPLIKDKKTDPAVVVIDEVGKFAISLLSGHLGGANKIAEAIADFLGGEAVVTTASDVNNMPPIDLWARENNFVIDDWDILPQVGTRLINSGALRVYTEVEIKIPDEFLKVAEPRFGDVLITNRKDVYLSRPTCNYAAGEQCSTSACRVKSQLYLRPRNLVVGIGCNSGTSEKEIEDAVKKTLEENNLSFSSIHSIATIDIKANEHGLAAFAKRHNFEINAFTPDELNTVQRVEKSEAAFKATGAIGVAEPAAIISSGNDKLLVQKQKIGNVTVAIAEKRSAVSGQQSEKKGKVYIIGTGPGSIEHITPYARNAIRKSDVIVGYDTYLDLIRELINDKEIVSTGMTQEIDRCKKAVELAIEGKTVSVISSGDPGIYAMAGLVFEIIRAIERQSGSAEYPNKNFLPDELSHCSAAALSVEVIPGISALNACAARLGAPLMHDFAVISLSDKLTPWELIEKRITSAAMSDFVTVLYNPKSMGRPEHINKARAIFFKYRSAETPVGIVKGAMREDESVIITNLRDMLNYDIDMQTTVIIGNSQTFTWNNRMITPRGYEKKWSNGVMEQWGLKG